jgi:hypothetical protein
VYNAAVVEQADGNGRAMHFILMFVLSLFLLSRGIADHIT